MHYLGTADEGIVKLARSLGWEEELHEMFERERAILDGKRELEATGGADGLKELSERIKKVVLDEVVPVVAPKDLDEVERIEGEKPTVEKIEVAKAVL